MGNGETPMMDDPPLDISQTEGRETGDYLYVSNELIARVEATEELRERFPSWEVEQLGDSGFALFSGIEESIPALVDRLENDVEVVPHHVLAMSHHVQFGPVDAPLAIRDQTSPYWDDKVAAEKNLSKTDPRDRHVVVIDTGLLPRGIAPAIYQGNGVGYDQDNDPPGQVNNANIAAYVGHGTFVAGHILIQATNAIVHSFRPRQMTPVANRLGIVATSDRRLAERLDFAFDWCERKGYAPAVLNLSLSGAVHAPNGPNQLPLSRTALDRWVDSGVKIVAAAGNAHSDIPHYPAAWDDVCGVGAVDRAGNVTDWSNYGTWVNEFALGDNTVSAYIKGGDNSKVEVDGKGPGTRNQTQGPWYGFAVWSGTSFAAPRVAGQIAAGDQGCR